MVVRGKNASLWSLLALLSLGYLAEGAHGAAASSSAPPVSSQAPEPSSLPRAYVARCSAGTIDLDGECLPLGSESTEEEGALSVVTNAHTDRTGHLVAYEHLPRRPEVPAEYARFVYPVEPWNGHVVVSSGYDLDQPDALQRRGAELLHVGHGGVDLPQDRGATVRVLALRGQVGDAQVLYAGPLFGTTVVLLHLVREGGSVRAFAALHGHLDAFAPGLARGQTLGAGSVLGFVGDTGAPGQVHLHYELRLLRAGLDPMTLQPPTEVVAREVSVPCDPRNLLPLRP